jgi:hypothetical protein
MQAVTTCTLLLPIGSGLSANNCGHVGRNVVAQVLTTCVSRRTCLLDTHASTVGYAREMHTHTHTHGACEVRTRPQAHSSHQPGACSSSIQHTCGVHAKAQHAHTCPPSGEVDEQLDMLVGSCIARWSYVPGLSMPIVLLQLRSRLAVCLLYDPAIGMHACVGRFANYTLLAAECLLASIRMN